MSWLGTGRFGPTIAVQQVLAKAGRQIDLPMSRPLSTGKWPIHGSRDGLGWIEIEGVPW
jgi:hypothetical protein